MEREKIPSPIKALKEQAEDIEDALGAVKEALVHITNKFSIPVDITGGAARDILQAFSDYQQTGTPRGIPALRDLAVHIVDEALASKRMNTDDIMQEFELQLIERLPSTPGN